RVVESDKGSLLGDNPGPVTSLSVPFAHQDVGMVTAPIGRALPAHVNIAGDVQGSSVRSSSTVSGQPINLKIGVIVAGQADSDRGVAANLPVERAHGVPGRILPALVIHSQ